MSAVTSLLYERRQFTPAEVERNRAMREQYWRIMFLIIDAEFERRVTSREATALSDAALVAWFDGNTAGLDTIEAELSA